MPKASARTAQPAGGTDRAPARLGAAAVLLAAGIPFLLGKYFELSVPDFYDSSMYVYSARHVLQGARLGVEEIPSAHIGTLLVNMLGVGICGFSETGPKLIQGLMQLGALALMFAALRRLFGIWAASVGVILASVYLSAPVIAKAGNVKEQYMIACAVAGICCFLRHQLAGPEKRRAWIWAVAAGALLSWAPLFKPTGIAAPLAMILFLSAQPLLKNRTLRQTRSDFLLLLLGAAVALAPLYIWIVGWGVKMDLPYGWLRFVVARFVPAGAGPAGPAAAGGSYLSGARKLVTLGRQGSFVLRYYTILSLPIGLALCSLLLRATRAAAQRLGHHGPQPRPYEHFVLLLGLWWILDMAFVWVSPRPYEQYYLPLTASAAMLGGYAIALYAEAVRRGASRRRAWIAGGVVGAIAMAFLIAPIFAGTDISPTAGKSLNQRTRGYIQAWEKVTQRRAEGPIAPWEQAADYIRSNSEETDAIYIWGWVPGIYVRAGRFSSSPVACTSEMQVEPPAKLSGTISDLLVAFDRKPPRFIVDPHNRHFPYDPPRPVLELWPTLGNCALLLDHLSREQRALAISALESMGLQADDLALGRFLRPDRLAAREHYEAAFARELDRPQWPDEAARFAAMKPLRDFVMANYQVVQTYKDVVIMKRVSPTEAR